MIDVIIPTLNRKNETIKTLKSLFFYNENVNVTVVDNGSDDPGYLDRFDINIIKNSKNEGIPKALNKALLFAKSKYVVLMHNDIVVSTDNWINKAISFMESDKKVGMVGIAGFKRLRRNIEVTNLVTGIEKYAKFEFKRIQGEFDEVIVLDGCCVVIRNVGLRLDERLDYYFYDWDLSMQYRKLGFSLYAMNSKTTHFADDRTKATINDIKYKNLHPDEKLHEQQSKDYFIKKWDKYIPEEVVVTANIGGVDNPIEKHFDNPGFNYIMFADGKDTKSSFWNVKYIKTKLNNNRREARMYKWLIHKFFPDVQYSIWVDSNIIIMSELTALIRMYLAGADIALIKHWRNCIYEEAKVCIEFELDDIKTIEKQMLKFRAEGYPVNNGLHQTRVILRRHTPQINALNEAIWKEICSGSLRDQLSFNYMVWKMGIKVNNIPGTFKLYSSINQVNIEDHYNFGLVKHIKQNRFYN